MAYLCDTNIFLRLAKKNDPARQVVLDALRELRVRKEELCYTSQVLGEFWNVCTRPASARGGLGLSCAETERKARLIERHFHFLPDSLLTHQEWRRLIVAHSVVGVQVHDARLVASMNAHRITHLLTFNGDDFQRFQGIMIINPAEFV